MEKFKYSKCPNFCPNLYLRNFLIPFRKKECKNKNLSETDRFYFIYHKISSIFTKHLKFVILKLQKDVCIQKETTELTLCLLPYFFSFPCLFSGTLAGAGV